ncbi:MAG: SBBP repeat-containing protein [Verrucomicrobia bacterium]|nr:SBBP repeat-containing protein [Verrucomicrobiota bacterium]
MKTTFRISLTTLTVAAVLSLALQDLVHGASAENLNHSGPRPPHLQPTHAAKLNMTPRGFIPNVGQMPNEAVKFIARGSGVSAYFTDQGFVLWNGQTTTVTRDGMATQVPVAPRWELVGARPVEPVGGKTFAHTVSFFRGNDRAKWHANVPAYRDLRYPEILKGVELRVESRERGFEYSFHVQPHAKPDLRVRYDGITALEKSPVGDLIVRTAKGHFTESRPVSYQIIEGARCEVASRFELVSASEYRVAVGSYDERHELVIDPVLDWSTFLGRSTLERHRDVVVDPAGNVCVAGDTFSTDLPDTAGFSTGPGVTYDSNLDVWYEDAYVAKLSPDGTQLLWLGYLAGAGATSDAVGVPGNGLAVDTTGNLYVAGFTYSPDFPVTTGVPHSGAADAYVTKIKSDGSIILWSTLLGGAGEDWGSDVGLDPQENVYLTGFTLSGDFPALNAFDPTLGGSRDGFVAKFDTAGALQWSSYLGGSNEERIAAIVADANGGVFVFGDTGSADFPVTAGALDTTLGGNNDAFVTKLAADGSGIIWSTFLGGSGAENELQVGAPPTSATFYLSSGRGEITLDSAGNIVVGGQTFSADFPVTPGAFDTTLADEADGYVAKIAADGTSLVWATYLGGSGAAGERGEAIFGAVVNPWDEVFVVGRTDSTDFPVTADAVQTVYPGGSQDGFLTKLSADGSTLLYSTYLGSGAPYDAAVGLEYHSGNVFVTANAGSDFPTTAGSYQPDCFSCDVPPLYWGDGAILKFLDAFIAHDGFESGNYSGGSGWVSGWTKSGDVSILTSSGPHAGSRHVRLRKNTGSLRRSASVAGAATVRLGFWAKVNSFEGNDKAYVRAKKSTSVSYTTVFTFTPALSDNQYHYYEFDLTGFLPASQLDIEFDAEMNATNDNWYLDDIRLVGTQ